MHRDLYASLVEWKNKHNRKPLMLYGARQVGKTWLLKAFGQREYTQMAYIMMADNRRMRDLFEMQSDARQIISGIEAEAGFSINPDNTLIIFDEIQAIPSAVAALKYLCEQMPEYHIAACGSLIGVSLLKDISFPVGKVNSLYLYPMSFYEFARAIRSEQYAEILLGAPENINAGMHEDLVALLKQYYLVGGMPEAVLDFTENSDYFKVRDIQKQIISDYEHDFGKHAPAASVPRIQAVFSSLPAQLAKEHKKFVYGLIKKGSRAKEYEIAIQWLIDAGIVCKTSRVTKPGNPLKAYEDQGAFKLFAVDIGLLMAMSGIEPRIVLEGNTLFTEFKGAMTEQYVMQQIIKSGLPTCYYSSDDAKSEIDIVTEVNGIPIPIEVKSANNLASKSLSNFIGKYKLNRAVKFSTLPYTSNSVVCNVPLYLAQRRDLFGISQVY